MTSIRQPSPDVICTLRSDQDPTRPMYAEQLNLLSLLTRVSGLVLLGILVDRCRQDSRLLWRVLTDGGTAAVSPAFFLALVLCVSAFVLTVGAVFAASLMLSRSHCFELIGGRMLCYTGGDATTIGSGC